MGRSQWQPHDDARPSARYAQLLGTDDAGCTILHVDMDAFYASVEVRRNPALAGKPVIVGGVGNRGVVCSATYEAREYGVRSAMPVARARRLCPAAIVLPVDVTGYAAASRAVMAIFRDVTPLVEPLSLDEAFLDVAGARRRLGGAASIGAAIRSRIKGELDLPASVGVAPTKFVAKVASVRAKPDGMVVVPADRIIDFLHPLPIGALWGVGPKTEERLRAGGFGTVADIASAPLARLERHVGKALAAHLRALAHGHDPRPVTPSTPDRSIGAEETFAADIGDAEVINRELLALAAKTAGRLRASGQRARTVAIKIRRSDFVTYHRSRTLERPTDSSHEIYQVARELFTLAHGSDELAGSLIRLIGVRAEGITIGGGPQQLQLGERERGWHEADRATDAARVRFGTAAVIPGSLVGRAGPSRPAQRDPGPPGGGLGGPVADGD
ncbi:MAG: DNA polymerase IV [Mycobacteriales bacterium]